MTHLTIKGYVELLAQLYARIKWAIYPKQQWSSRLTREISKDVELLKILSKTAFPNYTEQELIRWLINFSNDDLRDALSDQKYSTIAPLTANDPTQGIPLKEIV